MLQGLRLTEGEILSPEYIYRRDEPRPLFSVYVHAEGRDGEDQKRYRRYEYRDATIHTLIQYIFIFVSGLLPAARDETLRREVIEQTLCDDAVTLLVRVKVGQKTVYGFQVLR